MKKIFSSPGKMYQIDIETLKIVSWVSLDQRNPFFEKLKKEYADHEQISFNDKGNLELSVDMIELKKEYRDQSNGRLNCLKYICLNQNTGKIFLMSAGYVSMLTKSDFLKNSDIGLKIHFSILNRKFLDDSFITEEGVFLGRYTYICFYGENNRRCDTESVYLAQVGDNVYAIDKLIDRDVNGPREEISFNHLTDLNKLKFFLHQENILVPVEEPESVLRLKEQQSYFLLKGVVQKSKFIK